MITGMYEATHSDETKVLLNDFIVAYDKEIDRHYVNLKYYQWCVYSLVGKIFRHFSRSSDYANLLWTEAILLKTVTEKKEFMELWEAYL